MTNIFENIRHNRLFKQLEVDNLLFVEFKCLIEEFKYGMWSEYNYVVFVTNGLKEWITTKGNYKAKAGEALFVKKGANFAKQYHSEDYCALMVFIPDSYIKNFITNSSYQIPDKSDKSTHSDVVISMNVDAYLNSYIQSLEVFFTQLNPKKEVIKLKFEELLVNIFTSKSHYLIADYFFSLLDDQSIQLQRIMEKNYMYNLGIEAYARLCNMSLSSFKRKFQTTYDTSPKKWVTKRRIDRATRLIETTDKTVSEIALDCGFEDLSHFTKVFKNEKNLTPSEYKNS